MKVAVKSNKKRIISNEMEMKQSYISLHTQEPVPGQTSITRCSRTSSSVPSSSSRPIPLAGSSTDSLVTCLSLVRVTLSSSSRLIIIDRPEAPLLSPEAPPRLHHLPLSHHRQLYSGETLPSRTCLYCLFQCPLFLVCILPIMAVYWWVQHFYRCSSRELQRLESLSRAPVFSHFSDTLAGLLTIRSFRVQPKFISELCQKIDDNTAACLILQSGSR